MKKSIVWQKYLDPLRPSSMNHPLDGDGYQPYKDAFDSGEHEERQYGEPGDKMIMTEIGVLGINTKNLLTSKVSMWILQSNFNITHEHIMNISRISGVEILRPISRYRFLVGFGGLFDEQKVKLRINKELIPQHKPYDNLQKVANRKFKHYAILNNGNEYELVGGETDDDVKNKISEIGEDWKVCLKQ